MVVVFSRLVVSDSFAAHQASLSFTISQSLLKLMSIESVMVKNKKLEVSHLLISKLTFDRCKAILIETV